MKQFLSVILAVVLVVAVGSSVASGTMAGFFDTEVSTDNEMCAGTRNLELSGGPVMVECAMPSKWYSEEFTLINAGTLEGLAAVHIKNLVCQEAGTINGLVYNGTDYVAGTPVGAGVASSEPELVAEEGGQVGQTTVIGLGVDAGDDTGPPDWVMSKHVDVKIWFDEDGSCSFEDDELVVEGKLSELACTEYILGVIPSAPRVKTQGGGWGSYFEYTIGDPTLELPLMMGQNQEVGTVSVWTEGGYLKVEYDTTEYDTTGWEMAVTHVYVGTDPPEKLAPGSFPYAHDPPDSPLTDLYDIPLGDINGGVASGDLVYIAAHAEGTDGETAWGKVVFRKFKIKLHLQQVEDSDWEGDPQLRWWPTNVFQGDQCTFDIEFWLRGNPSKGKK